MDSGKKKARIKIEDLKGEISPKEMKKIRGGLTPLTSMQAADLLQFQAPCKLYFDPDIPPHACGWT